MKKLFFLILLASSIAMSQFTVGSRISVPALGINSVDSTNIKNGTIVNADINANANIAGSKLADHGITYAKLDTGAAGFVDVRKFGATGDGTTDDTDAIQAAIDYVHSKGSGTVLIPAGTYIVSKQGTSGQGYCLKTYTGIRLLGVSSPAYTDGIYAGSMLKLAASQNCYIIATMDYVNYNDGETFDWWHYAGIENITFNCNGTNNTIFAGAIAIKQAGETSRIEKVNIANYVGTAIYCDEAATLSIRDVCVNPDISASAENRTAINIKNGVYNLYNISGDKSTPLVKMTGYGNFGIYGLKYETSEFEYGSPVLQADSSFEYTSIYASNLNANRGATTDGTFFLISNYTSIPQVNLFCGQIYGFKNTYRQYNSSASDSLANDQRLNHIQLGAGTNHIRSHQTYNYEIGPYWLNEHKSAKGEIFYSTDLKFHVRSPGTSTLFEDSTGTGLLLLSLSGGMYSYLYTKILSKKNNQLITSGDYDGSAGDSTGIFIAADGKTSIGGDTTPDARFEVDNGGIAAEDSLTIGAGGIWQRNWYYNAADSSIRIVFYNSALSRIDTVKCPQAN